MRFLSSLLLPLFLFGSTYKDHIGNRALRIESKKLEFSMDKRHKLDKLHAKQSVTAYFANKIVIQTELLDYVNHQWLESGQGGTCHLLNGELNYQNLTYDLKADSLVLLDVSGHLSFSDQTAMPIKAKKVCVEKRLFDFRGGDHPPCPSTGRASCRKHFANPK